jgi:hypothetical protein
MTDALRFAPVFSCHHHGNGYNEANWRTPRFALEASRTIGLAEILCNFGDENICP